MCYDFIKLGIDILFSLDATAKTERQTDRLTETRFSLSRSLEIPKKWKSQSVIVFSEYSTYLIAWELKTVNIIHYTGDSGDPPCHVITGYIYLGSTYSGSIILIILEMYRNLNTIAE